MYIKKIFSALMPLIRKNNFKRWEAVSKTVPPWDDRNELIAKLIPDGKVVLDLGAGPQTLRGHLPKNCKYIPCDLVKKTNQTIVWDFNSDQELDVANVDVVVCSGVLEYARKPEKLIGVMRRLSGSAIVSYNLAGEGSSKIDRLKNDWVNHFSETELRKLFSASGFVIVDEKVRGKDEKVFVLS